MLTELHRRCVPVLDNAAFASERDRSVLLFARLRSPYRYKKTVPISPQVYPWIPPVAVVDNRPARILYPGRRHRKKQRKAEREESRK